MTSPSHGSMEIYLDNVKVAAASLALPDLAPGSDSPFRIMTSGTSMILDELRFSFGALKPESFLTGGLGGLGESGPEIAREPPRQGESIMERRNREARERRAKQRAEAEKRKREEEKQRKRKKLGGD